MIIRKLFISINNFILKRANNSIHQMIPFGVVGIFTNIPFYYLNLWTFPLGYENFSLRIISTLLCFFLALKNYWPEKVKKFIPFYWYVTLLYVPSFFFFFMAFKNNMSVVWQINMIQLILFLVLLVDWASFIILITLGFLIAYFAYALTVHTLFLPNGAGVLTFFFCILLFALFSRNNQRIEAEKLQAMKALSATMAHELRTPFSAIQMGISGIKDYLPTLIEGYMIAKNSGVPVESIPERQLNVMRSILENVEKEAEYSNTFINMMLMNVRQIGISPAGFQLLSVDDCVKEALQRYPFKFGEKELVVWDHNNDFTFKGEMVLMIHLLFNLIKNALYFIQAERKGNIEIWYGQNKRDNALYFKDTARGISAAMLPKLFERFQTATPHGTGLGLSYCKTVMQAFGGNIKCKSVYGEFVQFEVYFPKVNEIIAELN